VGKVVDFVSDPKTPFMRIRVKPAAHLDRLEEVLVLQTRQELNLKKEPDAVTAPVVSPAAQRSPAAPALPAKKPADAH
jgi:cell shape-determining protein MreC